MESLVYSFFASYQPCSVTTICQQTAAHCQSAQPASYYRFHIAQQLSPLPCKESA